MHALCRRINCEFSTQNTATSASPTANIFLPKAVVLDCCTAHSKFCTTTAAVAGVQYEFGPYPINANEVFAKTQLSFAFVNLKPIVPGKSRSGAACCSVLSNQLANSDSQAALRHPHGLLQIQQHASAFQRPLSATPQCCCICMSTPPTASSAPHTSLHTWCGHCRATAMVVCTCPVL
jgi:hypothetical protein